MTDTVFFSDRDYFHIHMCQSEPAKTLNAGYTVRTVIANSSVLRCGGTTWLIVVQGTCACQKGDKHQRMPLCDRAGQLSAAIEIQVFQSQGVGPMRSGSDNDLALGRNV